MSTPPTFSLTGPLPTGRVAIEASAGTGKTFTIAGLVVRYVAEAAVPIEEILVVTFTRAATAELRDRVRSRLSEAAAALRLAPEVQPDDDLFKALAATDRAGRLDRLERAVADFDSANITTIHGFASSVLRTLGSSSPGDPDATLLDDTGSVVSAACADVLTAESIADPSSVGELPSHDGLRKLVAKVLGNPDIRVVPSADEAESTPAAARLRRLVDRVCSEVTARRLAAGTLSFDDVLTRLRDAVNSDPSAATTLRQRFAVALIDEFQDTDPVQWGIFSTLFGDPDAGATLLLVADPKQAIYAFRGANVHTYLDAAQQPGTSPSTLGTNWRSDGALLDALESLLRGVTFGDDDIGFIPVDPAPGHAGRRLTTAAGDPLPALNLRLALGPDLPRNKSGQVAAADAGYAIARDLALQVRYLLDEAVLTDSDSDSDSGDAKATRRVRPGDIAVLVRARTDMPAIREALRRHGIPAVVASGDSVLDSPAASQWRTLLSALARPADPSRARAAAMSWFFGWSAGDLDHADEGALGDLQEQLHRWAETLDRHGPVDLFSRVRAESGVMARLLAADGGDRNLTDLEHLAGLLQAGATGKRTTTSTLLSILDRLSEQATADPDEDVTARRVESEAEAVQISTVHSAKGLEFPIVCVPSLWRGGDFKRLDVIYQDPSTGKRTIDIAHDHKWPNQADADARAQLAREEEIGGRLRLLYVALTRARHQTLVWWSNSQSCELTGLARVLFAREGGAIDPAKFNNESIDLPLDEDAAGVLTEALAGCGDAAAVTVTGLARDRFELWSDDASPTRPDRLETATLDRTPDRARRRWSFSAITDRVPAVSLDPDDESLGDAGAADEHHEHGDIAGVMAAGHDPAGDGSETGDGTAPGTPASAGAASDLPLGAIPGGAGFGNLVHDVLEHIDFTGDDLDTDLRERVEEGLRRNPWPVDVATLVDGLHAVIATPLGPMFAGRRLREFAPGDRLAELSFELRLGEGGRHATDRDVGALALRHLAGDDPLRPWAEQVASGPFGVELAGHLTGSIDSVFRVNDPADPRVPARFVVVDYKTNKLSERGREPLSIDYRPDRLAPAMAEHHYPMQALLYSVALHRYLRWRLPDYEPGVHLGGIAYLFVRGLAGAATPVSDGSPHGVFAWQVPSGLVIDLSDLLDGRELTR